MLVLRNKHQICNLENAQSLGYEERREKMRKKGENKNIYVCIQTER